MNVSRRRFLGTGLSVSAVAVGLSACNGSAADPGPVSSDSPSAGGVEPNAFPTTVVHKFGETTIAKEPLRVVTVGLKEQDDCLAVGVVPVAATKWLELGSGGIIGAWATAALGSAPAPVVLDPRSRMLTELGFTLPADLDQVTGSAWGGQLSRERVDLLDTDAIVWLVEDNGRKDVEDNKVYAALRVHQDKREVFAQPGDGAYEVFTFLTVLSVGFLVDNLAPRLKAALDGDPATDAA